jgi:hypothetical protein
VFWIVCLTSSLVHFWRNNGLQLHQINILSRVASVLTLMVYCWDHYQKMGCEVLCAA